MRLHRPDADAEFTGDFLVRQTAGDSDQDFTFAFGQPLEALGNGGGLVPDGLGERSRVDAPYFNSGVLLIDMTRLAVANVPARIEAFRRQGILDKLYFDQDMLNLIFKDDSGNYVQVIGPYARK